MNELDPKLKATLIVEAALERKAEEPVVLDMRKLTAYADTFVILSGRSDRQVRSIADAIVHALKSNGEQPLGVEGLDDGNWVLIDCNDAIVHVFDPETRERYDLERLWRDAPRLDLALALEGEEKGEGETVDSGPRPQAEANDENDAADPAA
jgi:ribosome-associated protein